MASFWRQFIADFAGVVHLLNALFKKGYNVKTSWSEIHDKAVFDIKKALISYPALQHYDPNRPVWVVADASDYAIGSEPAINAEKMIRNYRWMVINVGYHWMV
jgi:hypothetical protein